MKQDEAKNEALDALKKIKKAERNARTLLKKAKEETSLKIIQDARDDAKKIKEQFIKDARNKAKTIREEVTKKAERDASKIREETRKKIENLRKNSEGILPEAVDKVSKEIKSFLKRGAR